VAGGTAEAGCTAVNELAVIMALSFGARSVVACPTDSLWIARESDPCKLPAFFWLEEIAISTANVTARGGAGTATQNVLVAHELSVVFAEGAGHSAIAGVGRVGAPSPFPNVAEHLMKLPIVS